MVHCGKYKVNQKVKISWRPFVCGCGKKLLLMLLSYWLLSDHDDCGDKQMINTLAERQSLQTT